MEEIKFEKIPVGIFDKVKSNKEEFVEKFIDELEELFPETVKDGKVDFQALLERFGEYQDRNERYELTWVGKDKARQESFEDIVGKTLKYIEEDSKNPETTENLYIEGDNLEVLKLLRKSYYGKIKMIYIDPPYNTGNDFVYKDDFTMSKEEYDKLKGDLDEYGERLVKNSADSGRYHSNWLNMMYPRLQVAKDLLTDDGFIFISIDENEIENLIKICSEIFGEENHLNTIAIKMSEPTGVKMTHASKRLPKLKEYVLIYCKSTIDTVINKISIPKDKWDNEYKHVVYGLSREELDYLKDVMDDDSILDEEIEKADKICSKIRLGSLNELYKEYNISTEEEKLKTKYSNAWRIVRDVATTGGAKEIADKKKKLIKSDFFLIVTPQNKKYLIKGNYNDSSLQPRIKILFADKYLTINPGDFWQDIKTTGLDSEGGITYRNGKKPLKLLERLVELATNKNSIVLDFFAGSASTAHAVINKNVEDGGNRKFIMVQLPEDLDIVLKNSTGDAKKDIKNLIETLDEVKKPHYLTEIGKERIRRSSKQVIENNKDKEGIENLDTGFKVFKVENTNFRRIKKVNNMDIDTKYKSLSEKDQEDFNPHFTDLDIVYELMLRRQDIELTEEIKKLDHIGDRTFIVGDTMLVCLEEKITEEIVEKIGKINTDLSWIILRDSAFEDDCDLKVNTTRKLRTIIKESKKKNQKIYWI